MIVVIRPTTNKQAFKQKLINMDTKICPIADNCEIHFTVDLTDKAINVIEYDTINETKTRLTSWSSGHWKYHNPVLHNRFDTHCRNVPKLRRALKEQMAYLRNPMNEEKDVMGVTDFIRLLAIKTHKTLKLVL